MRAVSDIQTVGQRNMNTNPYRSPPAAAEEQSQPVKVKAYGLIPFTRRAYLTLQILLAVAFVAMLFATRPIFAKPGNSLGFVNEYFVPIIMVILALEGIETVLMLTKFKKAERERTQQIPDH